jgi:cell division protein FtsW
VKAGSRGAKGAGLDHHDWLEDPAPRRPARSATPKKRATTPGGERASERRAGHERRDAGDRRSGAAPDRRGRASRSATPKGQSLERRDGARRTDGSDRRVAERRGSAVPAEVVSRRPEQAPSGDSRVVAGRPTASVQLAPGVGERRVLLLVTMLLLVYGLVMAYSASAAQGYFQHGSTSYFVGRQIVFAGLGLAAMWALARVDYAWYRRMAVPLAVVALGLLALVLVPGIGVMVNGARRWIVVFGLSFQPSELAKMAAVMVVATLLVGYRVDIKRLGRLLLVVVAGVVPASALIMLQPDLGSTLVLTLAVFTVLIAGGARLRHLAGLAATGVAVVLVLILIEPYRLERLQTFLNPWQDPSGTGFQATQSQISIASGGMLGVGLGNSVQKFGYLPEQGTDMIVGIIGEELGLAGLFVLFALYLALAWCCFRIAIRCKDRFGKLLASGITAIVVGQACLNIGGALGAVPLTGVPLPLVSLGGTSMVVVLAGFGILLNVATNRRSFIVVSPPRGARASRRGRNGRPPAADSGRRL